MRTILPVRGESEARINAMKAFESKIHALFEALRYYQNENDLLKQQRDLYKKGVHLYKEKYLKQQRVIKKLKTIFSATHNEMNKIEPNQSTDTMSTQTASICLKQADYTEADMSISRSPSPSLSISSLLSTPSRKRKFDDTEFSDIDHKSSSKRMRISKETKKYHSTQMFAASESDHSQINFTRIPAALYPNTPNAKVAKCSRRTDYTHPEYSSRNRFSRKQQVNGGKGSHCYQYFRKTVPKHLRESYHPNTPNPYDNLSSKAWNTAMNNWKNALKDIYDNRHYDTHTFKDSSRRHRRRKRHEKQPRSRFDDYNN